MHFGPRRFVLHSLRRVAPVQGRVHAVAFSALAPPAFAYCRKRRQRCDPVYPFRQRDNRRLHVRSRPAAMRSMVL
jgi:hypothetical protein